MIRIKRGYIAQRRRRKIRLFASSFRGAHSRLTRTIIQQRIKALVSTQRDKYKKKIIFRNLWITRINSVIRNSGVLNLNTYSTFINNIYKKQFIINRKILAQIAISNNFCFYIIFNEIMK
uniref:Large ribosomal subunit protein bL20c n=1 Tax=Cytinus hypocistis TaxID=327100 RepID=A0A1B0V5U7_9ROSI|nr:ribosomal protein L20 [Cytinus hypocistis]AMR36140.1 ribosomal protein L20 [Cytinus hypocistis]